MEIKAGKTKIGIIGAGTMGAGIALTALYKGFAVVLYDLYPESLEKGRAYIEKFLAKKNLQNNLDLLTLTGDLKMLAGSDFVIEAAIEDLALKQELFAKLDVICSPQAILATNTSTLSVTAIAAATNTPERVIGMHFFNPAPVLPLVEVIRAATTSENTVDATASLAEALGKQPVVTADTPGFIVNRVARPFYGEALRLLGEGVASVEEIDLLVEQGAGFKLGPFRLMDLIGIDINAKAMQSLYEQTFGEPRYRPHPIQMQKVAQGTLGRKTGEGFYEYGEEAAELKEFVLPEIDKSSGILIDSEGSWGPGITDLSKDAGYQMVAAPGKNKQIVMCMLVAGRAENLQKLVTQYDLELPPDTPILVQTSDVTVSEVSSWMNHPQRLVGFDGLFFAAGRAATLTANHTLSDDIRQQVEEFVQSLGRRAVWVKDSPGMLLPRIVCQLANEAAFAVLEGIAESDVIDKAMRLGVNYPLGPLEWGKQIGYLRVLAVLDHLWTEYHEERYRACTLLRKWARLELLAE